MAHLVLEAAVFQHTQGVVSATKRHVEQARGGALVVLAPKSSLDGGYMTKRMKGLRVSDPEFGQLVIEFTEHGEGDRWPSDYEDKAAQGMPKDGAVLAQDAGIDDSPTEDLQKQFTMLARHQHEVAEKQLQQERAEKQNLAEQVQFGMCIPTD